MRVIAVRDTTETEINFFGYGEYVGVEICPFAGNLPSPKIVLENGEVVWGCECWWGEASIVEANLNIHDGGRKVNIVPVERGGDSS